MSKDLVVQPELRPEERALLLNDLAKLSAEQRSDLYAQVCRSLALNPLTQPFQYIELKGKLTLYASRNCTDQLRALHGVSVTIQSREKVDDLYIVTARAKLPSGREDESVGAVPLAGLKGEGLANAIMKCETKAKRRVTLSVCGLSMMDETEVESIPGAVIVEADKIPQGNPATRYFEGDSLDKALGEEPQTEVVRTPREEIIYIKDQLKLKNEDMRNVIFRSLGRQKFFNDCTEKDCIDILKYLRLQL